MQANQSRPMLSQEQLAAIERNRQEALKRLALKQQQPPPHQPVRPPQQKIVPIRPPIVQTLPQQKPTPIPPPSTTFFTNPNRPPTTFQQFVQKPPTTAPSGPAQTSVPAPKPTGRKLPALDAQLISRDLFTITPTLPELQEFYSRIRGAEFDANQKRWTFPLPQFQTILTELNNYGKSHNFVLSIDQPPKNALTRLLSDLRPPTTFLDRTTILQILEPKIKDTLMPFQQDSVVFAVKKNGRVLIADDMGLGKTIQAIAIASYYRVQWPLLVICPSSVRLTWAEAFENWVPSLDKNDICVVYDGKGAIDSGSVIIISYELAVKKAQLLAKKKFGVVIADESHVLKNGTAKRTQVIVPLLQNADRCILLSGTPALSRPNELYNQISAIDPQLFPTFFEFGVRYCDAKSSHFGWDFSGASHLEELRVLLSTIMVRRVKTDVLTALPPKTREHVFIDVAKEKERLKKAKAQDISQLLDGDENNTLQLFRDTAIMKIPAILRYVEIVLETREKFLLFAHHKEILDEVEFLLMKRKTDYIRIDGRTSSAKRQQECNRFQTDENCLVSLLSITAAGVGLTLTSSCLVVFAELFWQPGMLMQAEDRCHRIGQLKPVRIRYLLAKGTVDDIIWPLLIRKLDVLQQVGISKKELEKAKFPPTAKQNPNEKITKYFQKQETNETMNDFDDFNDDINDDFNDEEFPGDDSFDNALDQLEFKLSQVNTDDLNPTKKLCL